MRLTYFSLSSREKLDTLAVGSDGLGLPSVQVEKDIWVCWTLNAIFALPDEQHLAFKGGTSLSKGYKAIDRFSEDLDVTVAHSFLGPELDPFAEGSNRRKRVSTQLRAALADWISASVVPHLTVSLGAANIDANVVRISDEEVHVVYPRLSSGTGDDYIKEPVVLEFGGRNSIEPANLIQITSDIASIVAEVDFPTANTHVLAPERTFWEKATLIHVECRRPRHGRASARLSRHWYDLERLGRDRIGEQALVRRDILSDVVKYKKVFYNAAYAGYDLCESGELQLVPDVNLMVELALDYQEMTRGGMFMSDNPPTFAAIVEGLRQLERMINSGAI